jgi:hypothetical protein
MMEKSQTSRAEGFGTRHECRSCRYLTLCPGVLDVSIIQYPFSINQVPNPNITIRNFFIAALHSAPTMPIRPSLISLIRLPRLSRVTPTRRRGEG